MDDHSLQQVIDLAVKTAVLKAKKEAILECRPIGSYFLTETEDDPNMLFGGGWKRVKGKILQCSDDKHQAGTDIEAGLPNITGDLEGCAWSSNDNDVQNSCNGAFEQFKSVNNGEHCAAIWSQEPGLRRAGVRLNASKSNQIYGKSDTVQPPTHVVNAWIRIS